MYHYVFMILTTPIYIFLTVVDVVPPGDNVVNFSDAEDLIIDSDLMSVVLL